MKVIDIISRLLPTGADAFASLKEEDSQSGDNASSEDCPNWPPDLFAVAGRIIEQSGCYTMASPQRGNLEAHQAYLDSVANVVARWSDDPLVPPDIVQDLWRELVDVHGSKSIAEIESDPKAAACVLQLFAIADEACKSMGWGGENKGTSFFSQLVRLNMTGAGSISLHLPYSLCSKVPPAEVVVLPKSTTASVGCTIRSLSHYLALLPPTTIIQTSWTLPFVRDLEEDQNEFKDPYDVRLLLIPFPFCVPAQSFKLTASRNKIAEKHYWPAYFGLEQRWLETPQEPLTADMLARDLVLPLIEQAEREAGKRPHGVVFPECAMTQELAEGLVTALADSEIEFIITGVLHRDGDKLFNRACTFVISPIVDGAASFVQNKHHRWRLDRSQTNRYALDFDRDHDNDKWWEDIDVSRRTLPFFGLRKEMSFVTLICEDLARTDPAMSAIRAVGPNLVVALLMDGPQLAVRWPGKYATVLAEDPGSAVLTLTCAGMVDRANWPESRPTRSVGLWREAGGKTQEIALPEGASGVMLTLQSKKKHQSTLDLRSDDEMARELILRTIVPVFLDQLPKWV